MKNFVLLLILFSMTAMFSQSGKVKVSRINAELFKADSFIGSDTFGWRYFVFNNVFNKQKDGILLQYKSIALGKITKVDVQNPLRIILFYESFNTVVILDNQLNETQRINFSENTIPIVVAATGMASQNRLWIYNSLSQQIGLFDLIQQEYREITIPFTGRMRFYDSNFNYFNWIDEAFDRFATDVYGKVYNFGKVANFEQFQIIDDKWYLYSESNKIYLHEVKSDINFLVEIDEKTFHSFYATPQNLAIFTSEGITNYKISLP